MSTVNERIRYIIDTLFDGNVSAFAREIDVKQSTLKDIVGGRLNKPSYEVLEKMLSAKTLNISFSWLMLNKGAMFTQDIMHTTNTDIESQSIINHQSEPSIDNPITEISNTIHQEKKTDTPEVSFQKGSPYYNIDFIGGFDLVLNDQTITPEYLINFREYNDATCWCNVTGHSMEPEITHGDIIALKELYDWKTYIPSGEIYGIVTTEHRTIKKVCPSTKEGFIRLIPSNQSPEFVAQDIPISIILRVYKVLGCMKRL